MHTHTNPTTNPPLKTKCPRPGMMWACDLKKFNLFFHGKKNTVVVFVDYHSTATFSYWMSLPETNSDTFLLNIFTKFYDTVCVPNGWLRFIFHPDNATIFLSKSVEEFCTNKGILIDPSVRYKSSTNGLAESAIKVLTNASLCSLATSRLHKAVYPFAWLHCEIVHRAIPKLPSLKSPLFLLNGSPTNANDYITFGSKCYILDNKAKTTLLQSPGQPGRFLGYYNNHKTKYWIINEKTNIISNFGEGNVIFDESNTQSFSTDRDLNEQLAIQDAIEPLDSPFISPTKALPQQHINSTTSETFYINNTDYFISPTTKFTNASHNNNLSTIPLTTASANIVSPY
jgi:hypothetical protein